MDVVFSTHAEEKIELLNTNGFSITKNQVVECLDKPDRMDAGYKGRIIAQRVIDDRHVLRVVFEDKDNVRRVITLYPGRRERYED